MLNLHSNGLLRSSDLLLLLPTSDAFFRGHDNIDPLTTNILTTISLQGKRIVCHDHMQNPLIYANQACKCQIK